MINIKQQQKSRTYEAERPKPGRQQLQRVKVKNSRKFTENIYTCIYIYIKEKIKLDRVKLNNKLN